MNGNYSSIGLHYISEINTPDIMQEKRNNLAVIIREIEHQIKDRHEIKEHNLYSIEKDMCGINTELFNNQNNSYFDVKSIRKLQDKMIDLEKEKRDRLAQHWKDTWQLQKSLIYTLAEYQRLKENGY